MEEHIVRIRTTEKVTHDVLRIITERPQSYNFMPGQATEISINKEEWKDERRPFTFTCLPDADYLEFTIKTYPSRKGVTGQLLQLMTGDELIVHDVFGTIIYKAEGVFIAGGAGVTPFIAIFRDLYSKGMIGNNKLIFANKTTDDIILKDEFEKMLGDNLINILSDDETQSYFHGRITQEFLESNIKDKATNIYLCGPDPMMEAVEKYLSDMGIDSSLVIKEAF